MVTRMETIDKAKLCLKIINERKAIEPVLFEVGKLVSITDYFLIFLILLS